MAMHIGIHRRLEPTVVDQFAEIHREAFAPLAVISAVRQSLTDDEFRDEVASPDVLKFLGFGPFDEAVALALLTNELSLVPWIDERFYAAKFPDAHARKAIFYFFTLLVAPEAQGGPWVTAMIEALAMHTALANGVVAFDCCEFNVREMLVPDLIRDIASKYVEVDCREVDVQHYYTYQFLAVREIDLRDIKEHGITIDLAVPASSVIPREESTPR
ncbi:MAG: hypothetical protein WKF43_02610 [Acidimicrobiales bacterium]